MLSVCQPRYSWTRARTCRSAGYQWSATWYLELRYIRMAELGTMGRGAVRTLGSLTFEVLSSSLLTYLSSCSIFLLCAWNPLPSPHGKSSSRAFVVRPVGEPTSTWRPGPQGQAFSRLDRGLLGSQEKLLQAFIFESPFRVPLENVPVVTFQYPSVMAVRSERWGVGRWGWESSRRNGQGLGYTGSVPSRPGLIHRLSVLASSAHSL